jgi:hypothetical protein
MNNVNELFPIRAVADEQHAIWAHWMRYMFSCGTDMGDGGWVMPQEKYERWQRQMDTDFADLTEQEQASDYEMAERVKNAILNVKEN